MSGPCLTLPLYSRSLWDSVADSKFRSMCTIWLAEALTRASVYDKRYLAKAVSLFENMLSFSNHLSMFSEEILRSGEQLVNTPQAFSHLALISAAFKWVQCHPRLLRTASSSVQVLVVYVVSTVFLSFIVDDLDWAYRAYSRSSKDECSVKSMGINPDGETPTDLIFED